jgi:zinc protease
MVKKITLSNGLTILLKPLHKSPVVTTQVWVEVGAADEKNSEAGMSHFIEHLLFKGTESFGVGEIAKKIEGSGGELNAYTSFDQTVYHVTISKNFINTALDIIEEMTQKPAFDPVEVDKEREVVVEEIRRAQDSPPSRASRLLFETVYKKHPYRRPVLGFKENIESFSTEKIRNYFKSHYVPTKMTLIVVGDFKVEEIERELKDRLSRYPRIKEKRVPRLQEDVSVKPRFNIEEMAYQETQLHFAWPSVPVGAQDMASLDVLALILGQGDSSRLTHRCRIENALVNYVYSSSYTPKDRGFFAVSAGLNSKNLDAFLEAIAEELLYLAMYPPKEDELVKAIINFESEEFFSMETVDGLARKLGTFHLLLRDLDYFEKYLAKVQKLSGAAISRALRKYLDPEKMIVAGITPDNKVEVTETLKRWQKELSIAWKDLTSLPIERVSNRTEVTRSLLTRASGKEKKTHKIALPNGAEMILKPTFESATVGIRIAFLGGLRAEDGKGAVSEMTGNIWPVETKFTSERELHQFLDARAASLRAFSGRNTVGLMSDFLSGSERDMVEAIGNALVYSTFPEYAIEREKEVMIEALRSRYDTPSYICFRNFAKTLFGDHPYGREPLGSQEQIREVKRSDLIDYMDRVQNSGNMKIAIVGAFDEGLWQRAAEEWCQKLGHGEAFSTTFKLNPLTTNREIFSKKDKEQSHVVLGYEGLTLTDPRRYALQILQSILAGQGGRLFYELRDNKSLAYSVAPVRMEGVETGYFGGYIACAPEKVLEAIQSMEEEFTKIADKAVGDDEIRRSKEYLIGRHDIDLQRNSSVASGYLFNEIYGIPYGEITEYADNVKGVTSQEIQEVAQFIFKRAKVISVVGPTDPFS